MPHAEQFKKVKEGKGFIAALDQSGGSTPKALKTFTLASMATMRGSALMNWLQN